jgi:hypothetical protein
MSAKVVLPFSCRRPCCMPPGGERCSRDLLVDERVVGDFRADECGVRDLRVDERVYAPWGER